MPDGAHRHPELYKELVSLKTRVGKVERKMPLPTPLKKTASKKKKKARMQTVMHELKHGPVTAPSRKVTSGKQRQKQNVAIALKNAGQSRKKTSRKRK